MILHGIEYQRPTSLNMRILADHVTYSFLAFMKSIFHFCLGCYCGGYSQNGRSNLSSYVWIGNALLKCSLILVTHGDVSGFMQKRHNSIAKTLDVCFLCIESSMCTSGHTSICSYYCQMSYIRWAKSLSKSLFAKFTWLLWPHYILHSRYPNWEPRAAASTTPLPPTALESVNMTLPVQQLTTMQSAWQLWVLSLRTIR